MKRISYLVATLAASISLGSLASAQAPVPLDFVVGTGETIVYNTLSGPLFAAQLRVEPGGVLRVVGPHPFFVRAHTIQVDGVIDLFGRNGSPVFTLNTVNLPEPGAAGGPGGGRGGHASENVAAATARGGNGVGPRALAGGRGGESGFSASLANNGEMHRAAGGGGGVLGPRRPVVFGDSENVLNRGLIALPGVDGAAAALGASSQTSPPKGGAVGTRLFTDGNPRNDFFGLQNDPSGSVIVGELIAPVGGQGGGGGGDGMISGVFPPLQFIWNNHDKGAGGGGGGGLGTLTAGTITFGPAGLIRNDGGNGAGGENTFFVNRVGGGSGGGSGGMLVLRASLIDLNSASAVALQCLGGLGGPGRNDVLRAEGGGGHGGPGLIQLHVPGGDPARVLLPTGMSLEQLSVPTAHVLYL